LTSSMGVVRKGRRVQTELYPRHDLRFYGEEGGGETWSQDVTKKREKLEVKMRKKEAKDKRRLTGL